jgi:mRNA interferase HigB
VTNEAASKSGAASRFVFEPLEFSDHSAHFTARPAFTSSHPALLPRWEQFILQMRIISKSTLRRFWEEHPQGAQARSPLNAWYGIVRRMAWNTPADVKQTFGDASVLKGGRMVFNISGNKFRIVTSINYHRQAVYIRFVGTHAEYDDIDAETI